VYPDLAKEWHPTENGKQSPKDFRPGSNKKVWWQCAKNPEHEWRASINDRTSGTGCPNCRSSASAPELRIFLELKTIFPLTKHQKVIKGYEVDIYLPELKLGIEYDGRYWHRDKTQLDKEKNRALQPDITLLRIRERGLEKLSPTDILMVSDDFTIEIIKEILKFALMLEESEICNYQDEIQFYLNRDKWAASQQFEQMQADRNMVVFENSISFLFPELAKQWHPTKNLPLLPEHFTLGSHKEVWWQDYSGREWREEICHRVRKERNRNKANKHQLKLFGE
jgi:hypothetical protein